MFLTCVGYLCAEREEENGKVIKTPECSQICGAILTPNLNPSHRNRNGAQTLMPVSRSVPFGADRQPDLNNFDFPRSTCSDEIL